MLAQEVANDADLHLADAVADCIDDASAFHPQGEWRLYRI